MQLARNIVDDVVLVLFIAAIALLSQSCARPKPVATIQHRVIAPAPQPPSDIDDDCETVGATDIGDDGTLAPCALRSTTKI